MPSSSLRRRAGGWSRLGWSAAMGLALLAPQSATSSRQGTLSFEDRVAFQRRIEEVYWKHRIWPAENPGPKPTLAVVLPDAAIRARVEDYLKKSNALDTLWGRPITEEQLQAEMHRMATHSRDPELLRELFAALGNDPFSIAETLVRQTLADRLIRGLYSRDERFHGASRHQAEADLKGVSSGAELSTLGAEYTALTWVLSSEDGGREPGPREIVVDARAWRERVGGLAELLAPEQTVGGVFPIEARNRKRGVESLPLLTISSLQESDAAFFVTSVLAKTTDSVTLATAMWPKVPFDTWWAEQVAVTEVGLAVHPGPFVLSEISAQVACTPDTWRGLPVGAPPPPDARDSHTAVWTGAEMIVWGGRTATREVDTGGRYNPATDSWVPTATAGAPLARRNHTAVWTGTEMVVWGGEGVTWVALQTGGRYNPLTDTWVATTITDAPLARISHTAVWSGREMIVWGGFTELGPANTGGRYDPRKDSWEATGSSGAPSARYGHAAVWTGEEMIVWGGGVQDQVLDTGGRYDPRRDRWKATGSSGAPSARNGHAAVWTGSEMILWGGNDGVNRVDTGARYDPRLDRWESTATVGAPAARNEHTAVWTGGEMIVWGGRGAAEGFDSGGRYDPTTDSWAPTSTGTGTPESRSLHTAVWTGTEMIVWGGLSAQYGSRVNTGGRYDPSSDAWLPTSVASPVPGARSGYSVVWTGSEMIVWGGRDSNMDPDVPEAGWLSTGGRYNPATDSWLPTQVTGLHGRQAHTAVWTGTEMIVWGGFAFFGSGGPGSDFETLRDGGRYNPITDSWAGMELGIPTQDHTAVWTGSEMIVWGGFDIGSGDCWWLGARYDPSTNHWLPTTTSGAPSGRANHTAVWTGSEMIVWGGACYPPLDTGGRYNPVTDSWLPTATAGAPAAGTAQTAAWTDSEMIIWMGSSAAGSRYEPSADRWVEMTTTDAPAAGGGYSTVWTGHEMIVWNGASGGRYDPVTNAWRTMATAGAPGPGRAVWTGHEMIVWGSSGAGGAYCPPDSSTGECGNGVVDPGEDCDDGNQDDADGCDVDCRFAAQITCNAPVVTGDPQTCTADVPCAAVASCIDPEGGTVAIVCTPGSPYGAGTTDVAVQCTDAHGTASAICPLEVIVSDAIPPTISIHPTPDLLWPPNHRMVQVDAGISATDNCGPPAITLVSVTSDEPDNGSGDGDTVDDIQADIGGNVTTFALRAEREGGSDGRVYTIVYSATDAAGNQATAAAAVIVPHDVAGVTEPVRLTASETSLGTYVSWTAVPEALYYNVIRTHLSDLREQALSYDLGPAACVEARSVSLDNHKRFDEVVPEPGEVFLYLVEYSDGPNRSSYGTVSAAKPREVTAGDCE